MGLKALARGHAEITHFSIQKIIIVVGLIVINLNISKAFAAANDFEQLTISGFLRPIAERTTPPPNSKPELFPQIKLPFSWVEAKKDVNEFLDTALKSVARAGNAANTADIANNMSQLKVNGISLEKVSQDEIDSWGDRILEQENPPFKQSQISPRKKYIRDIQLLFYYGFWLPQGLNGLITKLVITDPALSIKPLKYRMTPRLYCDKYLKFESQLLQFAQEAAPNKKLIKSFTIDFCANSAQWPAQWSALELSK